eukprot:6462151-Amphidinium_carterae.1
MRACALAAVDKCKVNQALNSTIAKEIFQVELIGETFNFSHVLHWRGRQYGNLSIHLDVKAVQLPNETAVTTTLGTGALKPKMQIWRERTIRCAGLFRCAQIVCTPKARPGPEREV